MHAIVMEGTAHYPCISIYGKEIGYDYTDCMTYFNQYIDHSITLGRGTELGEKMDYLQSKMYVCIKHLLTKHSCYNRGNCQRHAPLL